MRWLADRPRLQVGLIWCGTAAIGLVHMGIIWLGMGGRAGFTNGWPIARDDHPQYFHSGLITRHFLRTTGTTAGYDPSFMAGYAKSAVFPASSTLPDLVLAAFGGRRPDVTYKIYVFLAASALPWLIAAAGAVWRLRPVAILLAVGLFFTYFWTDFPSNYARFGMLPYLLVVPFGLLATAVFCRYLEHGGLGRWLAAALAMWGVELIHLTGAMVVAPAALLAYIAALGRSEGRPRMPVSRHLGVWAIPVVVLAGNAFWWLPGLHLAATKGPSDFAFSHPEGALGRLWQIVSSDAPVDAVLVAFGIPGLWVLARQSRHGAAGLAGFLGSGFLWGYLSGYTRALDFLQPGRHTYAFFAGLALASAIGIVEVIARVGASDGARLARWVAVGFALIGFRIFEPALIDTIARRSGRQGNTPFLTSRPTARAVWLLNRIRQHVRPGERLLYEEGGRELAGVRDPFAGARLSGLLSGMTGVEFLGGPTLLAPLSTNFTQFGEGKLFGELNWDRAHFERYARLYRPSAIVCWGPHARRFCKDNPALITILDDDGTVLIGRVHGFAGTTIRGTAEVDASADLLRVRNPAPGADGLVVLRYHFVPRLRAEPPIPLEPVFEEKDPVPFIGLRPPAGCREVSLRLVP